LGVLGLRKYIVGFLCGALFFSGVSYAADNFLKAYPNSNSSVYINGKESAFNEPVVTINNKLYLPIREFTQYAGYRVTYGSSITLDKFEKLPLSITKNEVTITINSIKAIDDNKVQLNVSIKNDSGKSVSFNADSINADSNIKDRKAYHTSFLSSSIVGNGVVYTEKTILSDSIKPGEEIKGNLEAAVTKGTENLYLSFSTRGNVDYYSFYINTKGLI